MNSKVKVFRIVTSDFAVKAHLTNTLDRIDSDLIIYVIGDNVKQFSNKYPHVTFVNVPIKRKINLFYDLYALINLIILCLIYKPHVIHTIMPKAGLLGSIAGYVTLVPKRFHTFTGQVWTTFSFINTTTLTSSLVPYLKIADLETSLNNYVSDTELSTCNYTTLANIPKGTNSIYGLCKGGTNVDVIDGVINLSIPAGYLLHTDLDTQ